MYGTNIATSFDTQRNFSNGSDDGGPLPVALHLLDTGRIQQADELLTAATMADPSDPELWLAAGICRLRRGNVRAAEAAFEMSAWLDDNAEARSLATLSMILPR